MPETKEQQEDNMSAFLDALAEISRRYKIGIAGQPVLFNMENEDYERSYSCDAESRLAFD
jgi:hypothetical protein